MQVLKTRSEEPEQQEGGEAQLQSWPSGTGQRPFLAGQLLPASEMKNKCCSGARGGGERSAERLGLGERERGVPGILTH